MIDKTQNPAEIYLVPVFDGDHDHVWCDTPAPGEGMREEDATRYVREDIYLALQAQVEQLQRTTFDVVCASAILGVPINEEESHKCLAARDAEVATKAVEQFANFVFDESLKKRKGVLPVLSLAKEFNEAQRTGKLPPLLPHVG